MNTVVAPNLLPPGPRIPLWRAAISQARSGPLPMLDKMASYGDVAARPIGGDRAVYLISDPHLIRDVLITHDADFRKGTALQNSSSVLGQGLLTSEGEIHKTQRKRMQPALHAGRIPCYAETMVRLTREMSRQWRDGQAMDVHQQMMALTVSIVAETLFGANVADDLPKIGAAVDAVIDVFDRTMAPWGRLAGRLPLPRTLRFRKALRYLNTTIERLIAQRRAAPGDQIDRGDLLSIILGFGGDEPPMSDALARDEAITIFLAGHETTANALAFTWYLLAKHPEEFAIVAGEVDAVLGDRAATAEDVPQLPRTRMAIAEAMRLYPPAWAVGRSPLRDVTIGPWMIRQGSLVLMSQFLVHRDARWFPNPLKFDPLRWTDDAIAARPRFSYFPFAAGSRVCIGESFAWMELTLVVATIAQRWRFEINDRFEPALSAKITLRPRHGIPAVTRLRKSAREPV